MRLLIFCNVDINEIAVVELLNEALANSQNNNALRCESFTFCCMRCISSYRVKVTIFFLVLQLLMMVSGKELFFLKDQHYQDQ